MPFSNLTKPFQIALFSGGRGVAARRGGGAADGRRRRRRLRLPPPPLLPAVDAREDR